MVVWLTDNTCFPDAETADEHGIVAVGGDYRIARLLTAYSKGIFPWPHAGLLLWFCPDPRFVLKLDKINLSRSMRKILKSTPLLIRADNNFLMVIKKCQELHNMRHGGTWITDDLINGYYALHQMGYAHSIEAYDGNKLVGGLYGIALGNIFYGESMFFEQANASKICLVVLMAHLRLWGIALMDCQDYTDHLAQFGAHFMPRRDFLEKVKQNQKVPSKKAPWLLQLSPALSVKYLTTS
jgi:leucyl/phenylalanyl-tRNA---protein transferase